MEDDGFRVVNSCHGGPRPAGNRAGLRVPQEEGTANSVPAAAVIQRSQALFGFIGRKGRVGGPVQSGGKARGLTPEGTPILPGFLEGWRGDRNSRCSSEMRRAREEDRWRRRISGQHLTLRREGQGSKRD